MAYVTIILLVQILTWVLLPCVVPIESKRFLFLLLSAASVGLANEVVLFGSVSGRC